MGTTKNAKKRGNNKRRRYVFREGRGTPIWIKLPCYMNTEIGQESLRRFRESQNEIMDAIQIAPDGERITFGELGSRDFKRHWFKKPIIVKQTKIVQKENNVQ